MLKPPITLVLALLMLGNLSAQETGIRMSIGTTHYLGDLAPFTSNLSTTEGHLATTIAYVVQPNEYMTYFSKVLVGKLSGSDANAVDPARKKRNLSFETDLYEFGIGMEVNLVTVNPKFLKYGVDFYITGGVSVYHINPKAFYQGALYELQPLGTEGQGSDLNARQKYKLWQLSFPMGIGFSFRLNDTFSMGFEIVPRYTTTDYIDDVSTNYINTQSQISSQGDLTAALANRMGELQNPGEIVNVATGVQRGDPNDRDWYLFNSLTFGMGLGKMKKKSNLSK